MTAFLALAGLAYVYLTLQLYHLGERRKAVENELVKLRTQNDEAAGQIAALKQDRYQGWLSLETHWKGPSGDKLEASVICGRRLRELAVHDGVGKWSPS